MLIPAYDAGHNNDNTISKKSFEYKNVANVYNPAVM